MILAVSAPHTTVRMQWYNHTVSCVLQRKRCQFFFHSKLEGFAMLQGPCTQLFQATG